MSDNDTSICLPCHTSTGLLSYILTAPPNVIILQGLSDSKCMATLLIHKQQYISIAFPFKYYILEF